MVSDAESHAEEDKKKREEADTRNKADQMAFETEKQLSELGDKLDENTKSSLQSAVDRVRTALKGTDTAEIKAASDELTKIWNEAAQVLYQTQAQQEAGAQQEAASGAGTADSGGSAGKEDQVVDADYEVVDEDEKDKDKPVI